LETIEGQEIILNLLYDDMEKKNKEIEDLKKLLDDNKKETLDFEKRKNFLKLVNNLKKTLAIGQNNLF
jgi:hypothetical protein